MNFTLYGVSCDKNAGEEVSLRSQYLSHNLFRLMTGVYEVVALSTFAHQQNDEYQLRW